MPPPPVIEALVPAFPASAQEQLARPALWSLLRALFVEAFYRAQFDDWLAGDDGDPFHHFLTRGMFAGYRPTLYFNDGYYRRRLDELAGAAGTVEPIRPGTLSFAHWLTIGRKHRIVPTPLFDEDNYARHVGPGGSGAARPGGMPPFEAFLYSGSRSSHRVTPWVYIPPATAGASGIAAVDVVISDERGGYGTPVTATVTPPATLKETSRLERAAMLAQSKIARLPGGKLRELIERAAEMEPLIRTPGAEARLIFPPIVSPVSPLVAVGARIRAEIGIADADMVILISGGKDVGAAHLVTALAELKSGDTVLVLQTDRPDAGGAGRLPPAVAFADLSGHVGKGTDANRSTKVRLLLDCVRGLEPRLVVNIGSTVGWSLYRRYSRQLAAWSKLACQISAEEYRGNGPRGDGAAASLGDCIENLTAVLTDSISLRDKVVARHALPDRLRSKLHVVHPPGARDDRRDYRDEVGQILNCEPEDSP